MSPAKVRMVPRQVQLRLDEPTDAELLALLRTERDARDEAWYDATDAITNLWRALQEHPRYLAILDRTRALRAQVRAGVTP